MDNQRTILWALFAGMVFLTWTEWQRSFAPEPQAELSQTAVVEETLDDIELPDASTDQTSVTPAAPVKDAAVKETPTTEEKLTDEKLIKVSNGLLEVEISTLGGTLVSATLPAYPLSKSQPDVPVQLLNNTPGNQYVLASGLVDSNRSGPTHLTN